LKPPQGETQFPCVNWRKNESHEANRGENFAMPSTHSLSLYEQVTLEVMQMLDLTEGRTLFNMQKYWQHVCTRIIFYFCLSFDSFFYRRIISCVFLSSFSSFLFFFFFFFFLII
jgi:hypothetical protein